MTDTTILAAFVVGFISFVSPCVLPLVPGYLSAISGGTAAELSGDAGQTLRRVGWPALVFCLSFSAVFIALGATASGIGDLLQDHRATLNKAAGLVIVAMGLLFVASAFVDKLNRQWHPQTLLRRAGSGGPLVAGAAFAFAWTPCIGPTLTAILSAAATEQSVGRGALLLAAYSAGLAVPFMASALAFSSAIGAFRWLRDHYRLLTAIAGVTLIAMGALIYSNELFRLNIEAQQLLDRLGINFFQEL